MEIEKETYVAISVHLIENIFKIRKLKSLKKYLLKHTLRLFFTCKNAIFIIRVSKDLTICLIDIINKNLHIKKKKDLRNCDTKQCEVK